MEKPGIAGDNRPQPVGGRWTTSCTGCGTSRFPQPVEIVRPRFHSPLSWAVGLEPASLWTQFGTTPQSPGCGRKKVTESVESGRNQASNRTPDGRGGTAHRAERGTGDGREERRRGFGGAFGGLRGARRRVVAGVGRASGGRRAALGQPGSWSSDRARLVVLGQPVRRASGRCPGALLSIGGRRRGRGAGGGVVPVGRPAAVWTAFRQGGRRTPDGPADRPRNAGGRPGDAFPEAPRAPAYGALSRS